MSIILRRDKMSGLTNDEIDDNFAELATRLGGTGATLFTQLTDAVTANLPATNTPLANSLASLNTAIGAKADASATASALAAKQATLVSGTNLATINGTSLLAGGNVVVTGGATAFTSLTDAASVNLPTTNTPLATALAAKQASLTSGANIKTINGSSVLGSGDLTVAGGATTYGALTDAATANLPSTNTPLATALAAKATVLPPVNLGTGAIALTFTAHANRPNRAAPTSAQTATIDTTGGTVGDLYSVAVLPSATASVTMPSGQVIAPGFYGVDEWEGGTTFTKGAAGASLPTPTAIGQVLTSTGTTAGAYSFQTAATSAATPVTISGATTVGSTLTAAVASGWTGTLQWQENLSGTWTNISGQTASTYVTTTASRAYRIVLGGFAYSNAITTTVAAPTFTAQSAPSGTTGTAYSYTFAATGATSFAVASGSLPASLSLNTSTGVLSGTPSAAATSTFVISATNTGGTTNSSSQSVTIAAAGLADNFSGVYPARSDGGTWTLASGTAPTNSAGKIGPTGGVGGDIVANLGYQNCTLSVDVTATGVTAFTPIIRLLSDGSAGTNYIGIALGPASDATNIGVQIYKHQGGSFSNASSPNSNTAVLTSGVQGTLTATITGAPSAPVLTVKFGGTTIVSSPSYPDADTDFITIAGNSGATKFGLMIPGSGVVFDNFSAS